MNTSILSTTPNPNTLSNYTTPKEKEHSTCPKVISNGEPWPKMNLYQIQQYSSAKVLLWLVSDKNTVIFVPWHSIISLEDLHIVSLSKKKIMNRLHNKLTCNLILVLSVTKKYRKERKKYQEIISNLHNSKMSTWLPNMYIISYKANKIEIKISHWWFLLKTYQTNRRHR